MHIEINAGGLNSFGTVNELQDSLNKFIGDSTDILSAFKTVEAKTLDLNGGIGNLGDALDNIRQRIRKEEQKIEYAKDALVKTGEFAVNTIRTDTRVAEIVRNNKEEFYQMHPWLRPPVPETDDRNMFQKAWDGIKEGFQEFGEAVGQLYENVKDTLKKAWDKIVEFYEEHKELIQKIFKTVVLVVAAVAAIVAVVSGGGLLVLVPLLTALGVSAPVAAAISATVAVVAVVSTIGSTGLNIADTWLEIDNPVFNTVQKVFNITAGVSNAMVSIGALYNAFHPGAISQAKDQLANQYANRSGYGSYGQKMDYLSDHVPGSDSGISRIGADQHGQFYHAQTGGGADIHVSTGPISQTDFAPIVDSANGNVNILTGTHGNIDGQLIGHFDFFREDFARWGANPNVHIYDITKLSLPQIRTVLLEKGTNVCAWCYSERCLAVLQALGF